MPESEEGYESPVHEATAMATTFPEGSHSSGAAGVTGGGTTEGGYRDRDLPPTYDGTNPEVSLRQYEKAVRLWQFETEAPPKKQGAKLLRALSGTARLAVDDLEFEDIACENGVKNLLSRLKEYYLPHLELSLPRAFESAVYGQPRGVRESFAEYVHRMDRAFQNLIQEGVDLPKGATGYIIFRQASLSEAQDQKVQTWCEGKYDRDVIIKALRRLDRVIKEKGKANYLMDDENASEYDSYQEVENYLMNSEDDDQFIFIGEGDLDQIYSEQEVMEALASYREVRQALKDQKTSRGYFPPKGYGKRSPKGLGKGKGKMQKVHVEQLKLRSRCWRCDQIGHWGRECTNPPKERPPSSSTGSQSQSGKSGFFVASGNSTEKTVLHAEAFPPEESGVQDFWLKQFVEERRNRSESVSSQSEHSPMVGAYKERQLAPQDGVFCGIVTNSSEGIVDTAAEGGLIGISALHRLQNDLAQYNLQGKWVPKKSTAKGVGGNAKVHGVILLPISIAKISGILETTVVDGEVPLLLPVGLLKFLGAVIDVGQSNMYLKKYECHVALNELPSGHLTVAVTDFDTNRGFEVPHEAGRLEDFQLRPACEPDSSVTAMLAQSTSQFNSSSPCRQQARSRPSLLCNDAAADEAPSRLGNKTRAQGSGDDGATKGAPQRQGLAQLASGAGQDLYFGGPCKPARSNSRLVSSIVGLGAILLGGRQAGDRGGHLCLLDPRCKTFSTLEVQRQADVRSEQLHPPQDRLEGWGQQFGKLDSVQSLPFPVGDAVPGGGLEEGAQDASEGPLGPKPTNGDGCHGTPPDQGESSSYFEDRRSNETSSRVGSACGVGSLIKSGHGGGGRHGRRSEAHGDGAEGERSEERSTDADDAGSTGEPTTRDESVDQQRSSFTSFSDEFYGNSGEADEKQQATLRLRPTCGDAGGEEGRTSKGSSILEVCPEEVQLLSLGSGGDTKDAFDRRGVVAKVTPLPSSAAVHVVSDEDI